MRCQDCGAPCQVSTIVCPFCAFEVGIHRVSARQHQMLQVLVPLLRLLVLLFLGLSLLYPDFLRYYGFCGLIGNIDG
ncbi:hypothetical protein JST97_29790 [bacterium]|nr:hypothetical protein [bacterium]